MNFDNFHQDDDQETMIDYSEISNLKLEAVLSSSKSTRTSLEAIRIGEAGLNKHRQMLLNRVPEPGDFASFPLNKIEIKDLAYLSASQNHEFALLRGKKNDILFHGKEYECNFNEDLEELLINGKFELVAHSHPDKDKIIPSSNDRECIKKLNQKESQIISWYTGEIYTFHADEFEDLLNSEKGDTK